MSRRRDLLNVAGSPSRDILDRQPRLPPGWGCHLEEY
jgi:hypothetical protein